MVLEFDHLRDKRFNIGAALPYRNWAELLAEIEKCEVVCANCHRRRTFAATWAACARSSRTSGRFEERAARLEPAL